MTDSHYAPLCELCGNSRGGPNNQIDIKASRPQHQIMRTTLTLDDDVAAKLKAAAKHRPFKVVVNEVLRAGLSALEKRPFARKPYRTRGFDLGASRIGAFDNVEEVLSRIEDEDHR